MSLNFDRIILSLAAGSLFPSFHSQLLFAERISCTHFRAHTPDWDQIGLRSLSVGVLKAQRCNRNTNHPLCYYQKGMNRVQSACMNTGQDVIVHCFYLQCSAAWWISLILADWDGYLNEDPMNWWYTWSTMGLINAFADCYHSVLTAHCPLSSSDFG